MVDSQEASSPTGKKKQFLKKMSVEYEARGLKEVCVDNSQIGALHTENNRERMINQSHQNDVKMLRDQLARTKDVRAKQDIDDRYGLTNLCEKYDSDCD